MRTFRHVLMPFFRCQIWLSLRKLYADVKDEDGDVVYTTTVFSAETEIVLPSTLSGDYEIQLVMGNWLFTGLIQL